MDLKAFFRRIQKHLIFRTLSSEFFFHPFYMKALFALHRLSPGERREYQFYRLQRLLRHARRAIPYWKHIKKDMIDGNSFDIKNFEHLPVLTREALIKHGSECVIQNIQRRKFRTFVTSGSTGIPKRFFAKKVYFQKMMAAEEFYVHFCGVKDFRRYGYATHKPHLMDLVTYLPVNSGSDTLQKLLLENAVSAVGGTLNRLLTLADKFENGEIRFKPKFLLSGSEFLTEGNKNHLEKIFQCPVYNKYVCAEAGILGLECPELGGFHIDPVNCYVEIVDDNGRPVANGERGRIIITTFNNQLMPLIRYDIGDTGGWIDGQCRCGLDTPRLFFEGRRLDYVEFGDGKKYSAVSLIRSIDIEFANVIAKQQIVQESLKKIILRFVPGPDYRPFHDELMRDFTRYVLRNFPDISIEVVLMPVLDNIRNGKHIIFESRIKERQHV